MTMEIAPRQQAATPGSRPRLVIADDDELVRLTLTAQLSQSFECVAAAVDAAEAVAAVVALRPDVVILDVNMPYGGAIEATRQIRAATPETAIVILSINESWSDLIDLLNAGAMTYLLKGVDEPTLVNDLRTAIAANRTSIGHSYGEPSDVIVGGPLAPLTAAPGPVAPLTAALTGLAAGISLEG
jgi:DNA-binding NarL/FixJ family response regulator